MRVRRVVLHRPACRAGRRPARAPSGRPGWPGVRLLDRVHRERANRVDGELVELGRLRDGAHSAPSIDSTRRRAVSPCNPLSCEHARADHPGTCPAAGQRNRHALPQSAGSARDPASSTAALEEQVRGAREPAADHHVLGLEDVHEAAIADARACARSARRARSASASPSRATVTSDAARDAAVVVEALGEPAVGHVAGELGGVALERRARCSRPRGSPGPGSCRGRAAPPGPTVMWPSSAPEPVGPAEDLAADDHAAAHAGAEREHHEQARRRVVHELGLGERGAVGVVVDEHRHAEAPLQLLAQRHARRAGCSRSTPRCRGSKSICDGTPTPIAAGTPTRSITRRAVASIPSRSASVSLDRGGRLLLVGHLRAHHRAHGHLGAADVHSQHYRIGAHS